MFNQIRNEISVLKSVSQGHKNIVTLWDYFETQNNLYLITDLALGGELFDRICSKGSYYELDAAKLVYVITSAVEYLHSHGIVHRDLKPENLLFRSKDENSDLLIADFGLSKVIDENTFSALTTTCGTPVSLSFPTHSVTPSLTSLSLLNLIPISTFPFRPSNFLLLNTYRDIWHQKSSEN